MHWRDLEQRLQKALKENPLLINIDFAIPVMAWIRHKGTGKSMKKLMQEFIPEISLSFPYPESLANYERTIQFMLDAMQEN